MSQAGRTFTNTGPGGFVQTLTGNSGGPVGPLAGNINVVGDAITINVAGNPGTHTLTISTSGTGVMSSLTTDDGHVVTPTGGTIILHGTHGLNTTGTIGPNTATVAINNAIVLGDLAVLAANAGAVTATTGDVIITAGDLTLPNTNGAGTQGIIKFGGNRWISNFNGNSFFGRIAGNTTTTGTNNVGVGDAALRVVSSGTENTSVGATSGFNITTGNFNSLVGYQAGAALNSGSENCAFGQGALFEATTGANNTAIGAQSLNVLLTGTSNIAIGFDSGFSYNAAESSNIVIGNNGTVGESNVIRIGTTGGGAAQQNNCYVAGITGVNVGSVASVVSISGDHLGTTTITAGTGIAVTPGANTITIAATTGGVTSVAGNTGGPQTGAISIVTANSTPIFAGAAGTITLDFNLTDNLLLGSSGGSITTGNTNIGMGKLAAASLTSGASNCLLGYESGVSYTTGSNSTALGAFSMFNSGAGASNNTAIGYSSLYNLAGAGTNNTCLGLNSATAYTTTESNNIVIGSTGVITDNNRIRVGTNGTHTSCFVTGIDGVNVGSVAKVVTMASDQLGTATITAGAGILVTPGANTITISGIGGGLTWSVITVNQTAAVNNGYFCNKAGTLALALPAASAVGDVIEITNENTALGAQFTQAVGQQILIGNTNTTLGATGTLTSSAVGDTLKIVCKVANTLWRTTSIIGNWTVV